MSKDDGAGVLSSIIRGGRDGYSLSNRIDMDIDSDIDPSCDSKRLSICLYGTVSDYYNFEHKNRTMR